jgi:hypothetical protein
LDRHDLEGGQQSRFIKAALCGEAGEMSGDLLGYGLG